MYYTSLGDTVLQRCFRKLRWLPRAIHSMIVASVLDSEILDDGKEVKALYPFGWTRNPLWRRSNQRAFRMFGGAVDIGRHANWDEWLSQWRFDARLPGFWKRTERRLSVWVLKEIYNEGDTPTCNEDMTIPIWTIRGFGQLFLDTWTERLDESYSCLDIFPRDGWWSGVEDRGKCSLFVFSGVLSVQDTLLLLLYGPRLPFSGR